MLFPLSTGPSAGGSLMVRTTVVGNYPRVGDTFEEQSLREAEREVTTNVLREQIEAGIDVVTDGQIAWYDSQSHVARGLEGIDVDGLVRYFDTNTYYRQPVVRGDVAWKRPILVDEWTFAQANSRAPVKAVLMGPLTLASLSLDKHYGKKRALTLDLAAALGEEVGALANAGAAHIQIDEPALTRYPADLSLAIEGLERIRPHKGSSALTLFTYFGDVAKGYRDLIGAPADLLGFDLVQGAATWPAIAKHGSEKPLVLGVIDARNTKREEPEAVAKKVLGLKDAVDLGRSYLSPSNGLEFLPRERAREKLRILTAAAKKVGLGS